MFLAQEMWWYCGVLVPGMSALDMYGAQEM